MQKIRIVVSRGKVIEGRKHCMSHERAAKTRYPIVWVAEDRFVVQVQGALRGRHGVAVSIVEAHVTIERARMLVLARADLAIRKRPDAPHVEAFTKRGTLVFFVRDGEKLLDKFSKEVVVV